MHINLNTKKNIKLTNAKLIYAYTRPTIKMHVRYYEPFLLYYEPFPLFCFIAKAYKKKAL